MCSGKAKKASGANWLQSGDVMSATDILFSSRPITFEELGTAIVAAGIRRGTARSEFKRYKVKGVISYGYGYQDIR